MGQVPLDNLYQLHHYSDIPAEACRRFRAREPRRSVYFGFSRESRWILFSTQSQFHCEALIKMTETTGLLCISYAGVSG